jgi:hypothetical protein
MSALCRICGTNVVARDSTVACFACGRKAAEYVLAAPYAEVAMFWDVSEQVIERRDAALVLAEKRQHVDGAAEIGAGLAVGYLAQGLVVDALVSAAFSLRFGLTSPDFCWCALDVLFDDRVFKWEVSAGLAKHLNGTMPLGAAP